jgi:DNA invertase Pin-like site-specific DNA recombinase
VSKKEIFGFMREMKGLPTLKEQEAVLRVSGIEDFSDEGKIYTALSAESRGNKDARDPWADMITALREGDEVKIAVASVLGGSRVSVLRALQEIGAKGANVIDVGAGETVKYSPEGLAMIAFAERAETQMRVAVLKKARQTKAESGHLGGRPVKLKGGGKDAKQLAIWLDATLTGNEAAAKIGISPSTAYRKLGPRDQPIFRRTKIK